MVIVGVASCLIPVPSVDVVGSVSLLLEEASLVVGVASDVGVVSEAEVGVATEPGVAFEVEASSAISKTENKSPH